MSGPNVAYERREFACALRQHPTRAEDILWRSRRGSGLEGAKFRRQVPIDRYAVDFYCHAAKLVVDLDGKQHEWFGDCDSGRSEVLERLGLRVIPHERGSLRRPRLRPRSDWRRIAFTVQLKRPIPSPLPLSRWERDRASFATRHTTPRPEHGPRAFKDLDQSGACYAGSARKAIATHSAGIVN